MTEQIIAKLSTKDGWKSEKVISRLENDIQVAFFEGIQAFTDQETSMPDRQIINKKHFLLKRVETIAYYEEI